MRSITRTLLVSILAGVLVVVLASGAVVYAVARTALRAQLDATLADRARAMGLLVIDEDGGLEFEYDHPPSEADFGVLVRLTDERGQVVAQSPGWPITEPPAASPPPDAVTYRRLTFGNGAAARLATLAMHATAEDQSGPDGVHRFTDRVIRVEVIGRTDQVRRAERAVLGSLIVGGIIAMLGSSAAIWLGVRRGLAPVRDLSGAVAAIEPDSLRMPERAAPHPKELRPIVTSLDQMLRRLDAAMQRERRFTDAAAHELRTPIAELRTMTDVAARWPDPDRLRAVIGDAREVVDEMEALLESLLEVARGGTPDHGATEPVALLAAARKAAEHAKDRIKPIGLSWTFEGDEHACWLAPRTAVTALLRNLLDNAAAYTPPGGSVHVAVSTAEGGTALEITNGPVSLEPSQIERMFEPFWRADPSRADRHHRGLGLAIVDALTSVAGVERAARLTEQRMLRVTLRRPHPAGKSASE